MARILIVGAGVGGIPMDLEMKKLTKPSEEVVLVSDTPTFHFVPSNPWVALGWRKPEAIKVPLAPMLKKKRIDFIQKSVQKVVPAEKRLLMQDGSYENYDYLVLATGPRLAFEEVPGLGLEGFSWSVCHVDHAAHAAKAWEEFCKAPGPIVVGAVQGASCFGPAYEYVFQIDTDLRKRGIRDKVPITLVTSEPYVGHLGLGGVGDSKGMLESLLREKTIKFFANSKVLKIEKDKVFIQECDENGAEKRNQEIKTAWTMFIPPFTGVDAVRGVDGLVNPRGFVVVNEYQQNPAFPTVYAVGVGVAIAPKEPTPVPTGVPKTGLMIESMGFAAAHNIRNQLDGKNPSVLPALNALCIADMGDNGLGFVASPQIPPRNLTIAKKGYLMHIAKLVFERYYLSKVKKGKTSPSYERFGLRLLGLPSLKK